MKSLVSSSKDARHSSVVVNIESLRFNYVQEYSRIYTKHPSIYFPLRDNSSHLCCQVHGGAWNVTTSVTASNWCVLSQPEVLSS